MATNWTEKIHALDEDLAAYYVDDGFDPQTGEFRVMSDAAREVYESDRALAQRRGGRKQRRSRRTVERDIEDNEEEELPHTQSLLALFVAHRNALHGNLAILRRAPPDHRAGLEALLAFDYDHAQRILAGIKEYLALETGRAQIRALKNLRSSLCTTLGAPSATKR